MAHLGHSYVFFFLFSDKISEGCINQGNDEQTYEPLSGHSIEIRDSQIELNMNTTGDYLTPYSMDLANKPCCLILLINHR